MYRENGMDTAGVDAHGKKKEKKKRRSLIQKGAVSLSVIQLL